MDQVLSELLARKVKMKFQIHSLGYDPEADELDLLINSDQPVPAYGVDAGGGILVRCALQDNAIVGATIRGYERLAQDVRGYAAFDWSLAREHDTVDVVEAIIQWQREIDHLSHNLAEKLGNGSRQQALLETLLALPE